MKPEDQLRQDWVKVFNTLIPYGMSHERVENKIGAGTPDHAYCFFDTLGWIEFKVKQLPKNPNNLINLTHWTGPQRRWIEERKNCKTVFMVLRCGNFDYFIPAKKALEIEHMSYVMLGQQMKIKKFPVFKNDSERSIFLTEDKCFQRDHIISILKGK